MLRTVILARPIMISEHLIFVMSILFYFIYLFIYLLLMNIQCRVALTNILSYETYNFECYKEYLIRSMM